MAGSSFLIESAQHVFILRYTTVATIAFVIYEYLVNFDFEVRFLWLRRFNIGFVLLFLCRYLPLVQVFVSSYTYIWTSDFQPSHCSALMKGITSLVYLQFCLSALVLFTRSYAVWSGNKRVFGVLAFTYIGGAVGTAYTISQYDRGVTVIGLRIGHGCIYLLTDHSIFYALLQHVIMDTVALCLLLYKSVQHARFIKTVAGGGAKTSLLTVMAHDGLTYYVLNLLCTVANMIVLQRVTDDLHDFLLPTQSCLQNVLCARLYFHLQTANENWQSNPGLSSAPSSDSSNSSGSGGSTGDEVEMGAVRGRERERERRRRNGGAEKEGREKHRKWGRRKRWEVKSAIVFADAGTVGTVQSTNTMSSNMNGLERRLDV